MQIWPQSIAAVETQDTTGFCYPSSLHCGVSLLVEGSIEFRLLQLLPFAQVSGPLACWSSLWWGHRTHPNQPGSVAAWGRFKSGRFAEMMAKEPQHRTNVCFLIHQWDGKPKKAFLPESNT